MMKKAVSTFLATTTCTSDLGLLIIRLLVGGMMAYGHGWSKLTESSEKAIERVTSVGFPSALSWGPMLAEFVFAIFIALGLVTRFSSAVLLFTMLVAAFVRHSGDSFGDRERALLYAAFSLALLISGPGRFSIDHLILRKCGCGKAAACPAPSESPR